MSRGHFCFLKPHWFAAVSHGETSPRLRRGDFHRDQRAEERSPPRRDATATCTPRCIRRRVVVPRWQLQTFTTHPYPDEHSAQASHVPSFHIIHPNALICSLVF